MSSVGRLHRCRPISMAQRRLVVLLVLLCVAVQGYTVLVWMRRSTNQFSGSSHVHPGRKADSPPDDNSKRLWGQVKQLKEIKSWQEESNDMLWKESKRLVERSAANKFVNSTLGLLVVIKTGPHYFERREAMRELWVNRCRRNQLAPPAASERARKAMKAFRVICLFVSGQSEKADVMRKIDREKHLKKDIFLAPIPDGYEAMTTKTQWILLWSLLESEIDYNYIMLIDDDAFVAFTNILPWLLEQPRWGLYAGHEHIHKDVHKCEKNREDPNCVTNEMYPYDFFPAFASGFGYLMSKDVVKLSVMQAIKRTQNPGLPGNVEDAMLGVLLRDAGVQLRDVEGFVHWLDEPDGCPKSSAVLVVGNAPTFVLKTLYYNEQNNINLCEGLW